MKNGQHDSPEPIRSTPPGSDGPQGFGVLFEHARRDAFSADEAERLWQRLASAGAAGGDGGLEGLGGSPGPTGRAWFSRTAFKALATLVVAGGLVVAGVSAKRAVLPGSMVTSSGLVETAKAGEAVVPEAAPPVLSWEDLPRAHPSQPGPARTARRVEPDAPLPGAALAAQPDVPSSPAASRVEVEPPAPAAAASPTPLPSEGALLLRARQAMAAAPAAALDLTDDAARRFPEGALAPEREVLAIEALARLGRLPEARARWSAFRAKYPQSPHLARLGSLVGP